LAGDTGTREESKQSIFRNVELRIPAEQRVTIYQSMLDSSHMDIEYASLLLLAGLIALFGLLENSAAVIIGAMLISPLMNPILSAALALLLGDGKMGKRAAVVLAISIAAVVGTTWLVALVIPLKQATPEILARTQPNLLDLFIAILSGLAGTLALRNSSVAMTILPGVAIAVAVIPPLSVVGYGLSTNQNTIAGGAFLLFITNLVSIIFSAVVVFRLMGFRPRWEAEQGRWKLKYRLGISAVVLILLSVPLFLTLRKAAIEVTIRSSVRSILNTAFQEHESSISHLDFSHVPNGLLIRATLETTQYVGSKAIEDVQADLRHKFGSGTTLRINQILVTQGGVAGPQQPTGQSAISGGVVKALNEKAPFDFKDSTQQSLAFVSDKITAILAGTGIAQVKDPELELGSTPLTVHLSLSSPQPLNQQTLSLLASQIAAKLGAPVLLHGSSQLTSLQFHFSFQPPRANLPLGVSQRRSIKRSIQVIQKQVGEPQEIHLNIECQVAQASATGKPLPRFLNDLKLLLKQSGLSESQWALTVAPLSSDATSSSNEGCAIQAYQNF
jgi:uncharacterized hydrophobic protein (TIGR00271 family)